MDGLIYELRREILYMTCAGQMTYPAIERVYRRLFADPAYDRTSPTFLDMRLVTGFPSVDDMFRMQALLAELYGDALAKRRIAVVSTDIAAPQVLKLYQEVLTQAGAKRGGTFRLFTDQKEAEAWLRAKS